MRELSEQVALIVEHLLEQDFLETDCGDPGDEEVLKVAQCLRRLGDEYNQIIQPHVKNLQPKLRELAKDQASEVFSGMVTGLCNTPELQAQAQQLGPEINLLGIAIVVGMNISKEVPELLPTVKVALTNFINTKLLPWIQSSGGWEKIL
ncbi:apoptosis regulator BAX-like [Mobula hypostoma]|uniref:apoptosis regulator BAX-like n=1 Tax=Mobula hypostoma TaxID=723540 RepID=UPI002FC3B7D4